MVYENSALKHTAGDTGGITITSITLEDGSEYTMQPGDTLTLTVRQKASKDSEILLEVTSDTNEILLRPSDTASIPPGKYSADIQLNTATGDVFTIWPDKAALSFSPSNTNFANFWIWPEVTVR